MIPLTLKIHGSNLNKEADFVEIPLYSLETTDFNDQFRDSIYAILHCLTKGIYDLNNGFESGFDLVLRSAEITTKRFKCGDGEDFNIDDLVSACNKQSVCDALATYIRKNYNNADSNTTIQKINNGYLIHLFRVQVVQNGKVVDEVSIQSINNARFLQNYDKVKLVLVSFENFECFGQKVVVKKYQNAKEGRVLEGAKFIWMPILCNFKNKEAKEDESGPPSNRAISEQFSGALIGEVVQNRFCSAEDFLQRIQKYENVNSLVSNPSYKTSFFNIKETSKICFPSVNFCKYNPNGESKDFDLPNFTTFCDSCWKISEFYNLFGFIKEAEYLSSAYPQSPPSAKPLDERTLALLAEKGEPDALERHSKFVFEKLDTVFNIGTMVQYTLLRELALDIRDHKSREKNLKNIDAFKEFVELWDDPATRPKDTAKFIKQYNSLAKLAREEGWYFCTIVY